MPKFTDEQIERAKNVDVRTFLEQTEGYTFQRSGKYLKCQNPERTGQPSSLTIDTSMNRIFYNSETGNRPLSALDWCREIKKIDFQSSMQLVLGENPQGERAEKPKYQQHKAEPVSTEPKKLELSEKSDTSKNVFAYLTKTRDIPENIVSDCLNKNLIYQDTRKNAVFVGYDNDNQAKYAARRGTFTPDGKEPFKRDCTGSDKNFAFRLEGKNTDTIYVTEAAIDALSLAALEDKFNGSGAYKEKTYISTGGAGIDNAVEQFCKTHDVKTINICFDDDEAGKNGMEKIMQKFREKGYEVNDMRASYAHDYNDELLAYNQNPNFYAEPPLTVRNVNDNVVKEKAEGVQQPQNIQESYPEPPINEADIPPEDYSVGYSEADIPPEDYYSGYIPNEEEPSLPPIYEEERTDIMPEITLPESKQQEQEIRKEESNVQPETQNNTPSVQNNQEQFQQHEKVAPPVSPTKKHEHIASQSSVIFGNTGYSKIPDKEHIANIESSIAVSLFDRLQQENIQFSGKFTDKGLLVAVSKDNANKVNDIIREETTLIRKKEEQEITAAATPNVQKEEKSKTEQSVLPAENQTVKPESVSEKEILSMNQEQKVNFLLASIKDRQEHKRADLLDKIDRIDSKIADRQGRIDKLNDKISDIETSLKTSAALKRALGSTPIGKLIDNSIAKKQAKIEQIRNEKIPKHENKIKIQTAKKEKATAKLGKVNRKIDKLDKVQNFFTAIGSKNKEERHQGFVTGLENLSDIRRTSLENKLHKVETKIDMLSAQYSSPDISHSKRYEIGKNIRSLKAKSEFFTAKIESMNKLHSDLDDIKNGKFTEAEIETVVNKTADKISERLENPDNREEKGIINTVIANSVESGSEAINEVTAEKAVEQAEKSKPAVERERTPEERKPDVNKTKELDILTMAAVITGVNISELNRLPVEVKADIIAEFQKNNGNISTEQLAERICEIADIEPPETINRAEPEIKPQESKEKENPLRELEDMLEVNDNYIDGILNNLPPEKPKKQEHEVVKDEPLFSRSKIMSDDFKPTSEQSQEDIEKNKSKKHNIGI